MSAFSSSRIARSRNGIMLGLPISSSPSSSTVRLTGSLPVAPIQARHASTKVMSWPLSSAAPRADDALARRSARRRRADRTVATPKGRTDRPAARRNGRRTGRVDRRRGRGRAPPPSDGRGRAHARVEADAAQLARQPIGGGAALLLEGGVGGDRLGMRRSANSRSRPFSRSPSMCVSVAASGVVICGEASNPRR